MRTVEQLMSIERSWTFVTEVEQAKNGSQLLKDKSDYNQIKGLYEVLQYEKARIEKVKKTVEEQVAYIEWKANCNQYLQSAYNGKINGIVEELRAIDQMSIDKLQEPHKTLVQGRFDQKLVDLMENLAVESKYDAAEKSNEDTEREVIKEYFEEKLAEKLSELRAEHQDKINDLEQKIKRLMIEKPFSETRVVWVSPTSAINKAQESIDQFLYSGKSYDKTVKIPFRQIHQQLIRDNYRFRNGNTIKNVMVGTMVFVISDDKHPGYGEELETKYEGGRTWIQVPIVVPNTILFKTAKSSDHSEAALKQKFEEDIYIKALVKDIRAAIRLELNVNSSKKVKIYQTILFLNSELNACKTYGCSRLLYDMQNGKDEDGFLQKLQAELLNQGLILSRKIQGVGNYPDGDVRKLRMQVSYSAEKVGNSDGCYGIHAEEAGSALKGDVHNLAIDTHSLNGEVVLETPNWAICDEIEKSEYILAQGIRAQKQQIAETAILEGKNPPEMNVLTKEFMTQQEQELMPQKTAFGSGHANIGKGFDINSWGQKLFAQNNDSTLSF